MKPEQPRSRTQRSSTVPLRILPTTTSSCSLTTRPCIPRPCLTTLPRQLKTQQIRQLFASTGSGTAGSNQATNLEIHLRAGALPVDVSHCGVGRYIRTPWRTVQSHGTPCRDSCPDHGRICHLLPVPRTQHRAPDGPDQCLGSAHPARVHRPDQVPDGPANDCRSDRGHGDRDRPAGDHHR